MDPHRSELIDQEMFEIIQDVQPADIDLMQRVQLVLRPDSPMIRQLLRPEVSALYREKKLIGIESPETRYFDTWKRTPGAINPEKAVRLLSQAMFARFTYWKNWVPRAVADLDFTLSWSRDHQHLTEGLSALSYLFAEETANMIRSRRAEEFLLELRNYPTDAFELSEMACSYQDWRQGFTLALLRFGAATKDDEFVKETVALYLSDSDFMKRFVRESEHGPRQMLWMLGRFAKDWDMSVIPLRFFTPGAALDFVAEQYHYVTDISRFKTVFLKGGSNKQCPGLRLNPAKPSIVRGWGRDVILLNASATAHHGYDSEHLRQILSDRYNRKVSG
jgi:hypothetical protein